MSTATGEAVAPGPAAEPPFTGPGEAQQAFLLALSDRVRGLADAGQIMAAAAELLGRHLGLALVQYLLVDADGDGYQVAATYADGRLPRVEAAVGGRGRISAHGPDWGPQFRAGEAVFSDDHDATRSPADAAAQRGVGVRSGSAVPLLRDGRLVAILATGHAAPRRWTEAERELQREVAERTWAAVERARAEAAMRASEARFRLLGEAAPLVVSLARPDGSIEYVNPFWETFSGRTAADFASGDWLEAVHPDDRAAMRAAWDEARATERPYASEFRARAADGTYRWLRAHGTPVRDAAGAVAHWVNVAADVHDRRRAEEVLRASEVRQAFLLTLTDALGPLSDAGEIRLTAAQVLGRHLGANRVAYAEDCGDGVHYDVTPNYVDGLADAAGRYRYADFGADLLADLRAGRTRVQPDIQHDARLTDAQRRALARYGIGASLNVSLVKQGRLVVFLGVNYAAPHDFTPHEIALVREVAERTWGAVERARAEAALRESEAKYRTLFDALDEGVATIEVTFDDRARAVGCVYLEHNPAFARLTGRSNDTAGGRGSEATPALETRWLETFGHVARTGAPARFERRVTGRVAGPAGADQWFDVFAARVGGEGSRRLVVVYTDITERRRREANLAVLADVSESLARLTDVDAAMAALGAKLAAHLGLAACAFAELRDSAQVGVIDHDWHRADMPSLRGTYRMAEFVSPEVLASCQAGKPVVIRDVFADPRTDGAQYAALNIRAFVSMPLVREGEWRFLLVVYRSEPYDWRADEVDLLREVTARVWSRLERARAEAALRVREEQYRTLFETMGQGYARAEMVRDAAGRAVDVRMLDLNPAYERLMGVPAEVARGRRVYELYPALDRWWLANYDRVVRAGAPERLEYRYTAAGRWYEARVYPRGGDQFDVLFEDVTERKEAEAAVRASEGALRVVTDVVPDLLWRSGPDGTVTWCNARWTAYTGDAPEAALGQSWQYPVHPDDAAASHAEWEAAVAAGRPFRREHRMRAGDGTYRWFLAQAEPLRDAGGRPTAEWFGAAADVHAERTTLAEVEWRVAERTAALADANARLAADAAARERARAERDALLRRLAAAQEAERSHLARELHDEVGQHLTAVGLELRALSSVTPPGSEVDRRAAALRDLVGTLGRELHEVAVRLRPRALDDFGLETALEAYAEAWARQSGIPVDLHARVAAERLAPAVESAVYRIVQEALTNVARHSGATRAGVVVERQDGHAVVIVEDDGRGIDDPGLTEAGGPDVAGPDVAGTGGPREGSGPARPGSGGLGLLGIRERATLLGGSVEIESAPGSGTTLFVRIPIEPAAAADKEG